MCNYELQNYMSGYEWSFCLIEAMDLRGSAKVGSAVRFLVGGEEHLS